jgi:type IV pilus assembly protein PilC
MANADTQKSTILDIGLSREDQARIEALRQVDVEGKKSGVLEWYRIANEFVMGLSGVKLQEKVTFYQLLAVMINAGVPIIRSLYVLSDQTKNIHFKKIIRALAQKMEEGSSFSQSMKDYPKVFDDAEIGMIASGEASGNLNDILKDIAKQKENGSRIVSKVKGAMMYPAAIVLIMIVALFLMLTMVVPKLSALFAEGGSDLPLTTQILITGSDVAQTYWYLVALAAAAIAIGFVAFRRSKKGKYSTDLALLYLPVFGKLVRQLMIARFTRMLASLMDAGLPIVKALEINANALGNEVYKKRVMFASQDVAQGIPLGENLTNNEFLFPPMVASMILVGEQTANLSEVATKIADYYESEVDTAVSSLSKLMEPVILVVMGGAVGFIVAAIMQPIMSLSDMSSIL